MDVATLRRTRIWLPLTQFVVISVALFPWLNARVSDGPQDGRTWAWNLLGWPLVPELPGVLIWFVVVALVCGATWVLISSRILRHLEPDAA